MKDTAINMLLASIEEDIESSVAFVTIKQLTGYTEVFELVDNRLRGVNIPISFLTRDFIVDEIHRSEGLGFIYAIRLREGDYKGLFVAYVNTDLLRYPNI